jgi:hypothetical protein
VTRRLHSSLKMEHQSVESSNEEIGSSMQKNCNELVKCGGRIWKHKQRRGNNDGISIALFKCGGRIWKHK